MLMKNLGDDYKRAWWEKLYSLFVTGKLILFFTTTAIVSVLLLFGFITGIVWMKVMVANIVTVAGFRGAIDIARVYQKGKINTAEIKHIATTAAEDLKKMKQELNRLDKE